MAVADKGAGKPVAYSPVLSPALLLQSKEPPLRRAFGSGVKTHAGVHGLAHQFHIQEFIPRKEGETK